MKVSMDDFADEMKRRGHYTFRCPMIDCLAVMWLEADDLESLEGLTLMRFGTTPLEDCDHCRKAHDSLRS